MFREIKVIFIWQSDGKPEIIIISVQLLNNSSQIVKTPLSNL